MAILYGRAVRGAVRLAGADPVFQPARFRPPSFGSEAGEAHALIHEHLRRRVAFSAVVGHPERYLHEGRAREVLAQGDLGDALAYSWTQKMEFLIVSAEVQAQTVADCAANMRAAIGLSR